MTDEELLAQAPMLPVLYFDGFGAYQKINGVLRCVGYDLRAGPIYNLVISLIGAEQANRSTRSALDGKAVPAIKIWNGAKLAH